MDSETQRIPNVSLLPQYSKMDHIEPFLLPPPMIKLSVKDDIIDLTDDRDDEEILQRSLIRRTFELIDLTDSPPPKIPKRMSFQSPVASLKQIMEEQESPTRNNENEISDAVKEDSPTSVIETYCFDSYKTNDEAVDNILSNGTP